MEPYSLFYISFIVLLSFTFKFMFLPMLFLTFYTTIMSNLTSRTLMQVVCVDTYWIATRWFNTATKGLVNIPMISLTFHTTIVRNIR